MGCDRNVDTDWPAWEPGACRCQLPTRGDGAFVYALTHYSRGLLYIGCTEDVATRLHTHAEARKIRFTSAQIYGPFVDRDAAEEFEREQIAVRRPPHNVAGVLTPYVPHAGRS